MIGFDHHRKGFGGEIASFCGRPIRRLKALWTEFLKNELYGGAQKLRGSRN